MRRKLVSLITSTVLLIGFVVGSATPAFADEGLSAIQFAGTAPSGWTLGLRGIAADMHVKSLASLSCYGKHVESIYVRNSPFEANRYIEFGWYVQRTSPFCQTTPRRGFIAWEKPGGGGQQVALTFDLPAATGNYRFLMYQNSTSPGIFRFAYDTPDTVRHPLITTVNTNTLDNGWNSGLVITSAESFEPSNTVTDYHSDIWIMNSAYTWKPTPCTSGGVHYCNMTEWWDDNAYFDGVVSPTGWADGQDINYS